MSEILQSSDRYGRYSVHRAMWRGHVMVTVLGDGSDFDPVTILAGMVGTMAVAGAIVMQARARQGALGRRWC